MIYTFCTEQLLPIDITKAWNFFSSPFNLSVITPEEMEFKILNHLYGDEIYEGMKIDYSVKPLFGIPLHWKTEIGKTKRLEYFTDIQVKGPYRLWTHTHTFTQVNNGVLIRDEIKYQLPLGVFGVLAHKLFVKRKIENIFTYRRNVLKRIFVN